MSLSKSNERRMQRVRELAADDEWEELLEQLVSAAVRMTRKDIDASACQTAWDFSQAHEAEEVFDDVMDVVKTYFADKLGSV